eukprot:3777626-Rhodomonas_salina.4
MILWQKFVSARDIMWVLTLGMCLPGEDDYLAVPLPAFARESRSMNALWVETWMRFESRITTVETLLCDFIHVDNIVLRLVVLGSGGSDPRPMLRLYFFPGSSKQQVHFFSSRAPALHCGVILQ